MIKHMLILRKLQEQKSSKSRIKIKEYEISFITSIQVCDSQLRASAVYLSGLQLIAKLVVIYVSQRKRWGRISIKFIF